MVWLISWHANDRILSTCVIDSHKYASPTYSRPPGCRSASWSAESPTDGAVLYACAGGEAYFRWNFTLAAGQSLTDVQWYYDGRSSEMVAMFSRGVFVPLPAFSERVSFDGLGGITLNGVIPTDGGNFTMEVSGHSDDGVFFQLRRSVVLKVGGE